MAKDWKKFAEKMDGVTPPTFAPSDWEVMQRQIESNARLKPVVGKKGAWFWGVGVALVGALAVTLYTVSTDDNTVEMDPLSTKEVLVKEPLKDAQSGEESQRKSIEKVEDNSSISLTNTSTSNNLTSKEENSRKKDEPNQSLNEADKTTPITGGLTATIKNTKSTNSTKSDEFVTQKPTPQNERTDVDKSSQMVQSSQSSTMTQTSFKNNLLFKTDEDKMEGASDITPNSTSYNPIDLGAKSLQISYKKENQQGELSLKGSKDDFDIGGNAGSFNIGFRLSGIQLGASLLTDFNTIGYGAGLGVDFQRNNWLFQTGVYQYQLNKGYTQVELINAYTFDTSLVEVTTTDTITWIDSTWVITGPFTGQFLVDTITEYRGDTSLQEQVDSTLSKKQSVNRKVAVVGYTELPLYVGYRFYAQRWAFDLSGGLVIGKTTYAAADNLFKDEFTYNLAMRPTIRYFISANWAIYSSVGVRYSLTPNQNLAPIHTNMQLGISYHW